MKFLFSLALFLTPCLLWAQPYTLHKANWEQAGYTGTKPIFSTIVNIQNFGADATGAASSNMALTNAIASLNGHAGTIYFPAGTYFFNAAVSINQDSILLKGASYDSTHLRFNLNGQIANLITIAGAITGTSSTLTANGNRTANTVTVSNAGLFSVGDWVVIGMNDAAYMTSSWALGSLQQTAQVQSISGNTITLASPLRFTYTVANSATLTKVQPRTNVGIEGLQLRRLDSTAGQASNIVFEKAANCWVNGIESDSANFAHVEINHSANIEVTRCYFHHATGYGGNGQGYGVLLQYGSGECRIEANYFRHLRHSILMQIGANGNVAAYNYSTDPYWTEPSLPSNSAGDLVLHGNYPFANLFEGNFNQNIVIDDSHGKNGPWNTFLRNRAAGYGIFMNFNPATDSVQFIGNEVTNPVTGLYYLSGNGHVTYGNNVNGSITSGTATIPDTSLYLAAGTRPLCMDAAATWPVVGAPGSFNTGTIYAYDRVASGIAAAVSCTPAPSANNNVALPLTLLSFTATRDGQQSRLDWSVATVTGDNTYTIQRSTNGSEFQSIGTITGNITQYFFYDAAPANGTNYYRLRFSEANSTDASYSPITAVHFEEPNSVLLYPQPATGQLTITCNNASLAGTVAGIYSTSGQPIARFTLQQQNTLNTANWPAGVYWLRLATGAVQKLLKE